MPMLTRFEQREVEAGIRNFELGFSTVLQLYVLEDGAKKKKEEKNSHYALCTHSLTADPGNQASGKARCLIDSE